MESNGEASRKESGSDTLTQRLNSRSLHALERPHDKNGSQERPQHCLRSEPPLSPWSSTADPDEMLSDCMDSFETSDLDGTSDKIREPSVSIANNEHDEADLSEFISWKDEEGETFVGDTELGPGSLATGPIESQCSQRDVEPETSHVVLGFSKIPGEYSQATMEPTKVFEQTSRRSKPVRLAGVKTLSNDFSFQPPPIIVSNNASDEIADESLLDLSDSYNIVDSPTSELGIRGDVTRFSYRSMVPLQRITRPGKIHKYIPNNYEMATQDRTPPHVPSGIDAQSQKIAADDLYAFCADADSTAADAAATCRTDASPFCVRRRRLSGKCPVLQIPNENFPLSQQGQKSPASLATLSAVRNRLQVPTYPTPPSSSKASSAYQHLEGACIKDEMPSSQSTTSCNSPVETRSTVPPSPFTLPEVADGIARCEKCTNALYVGPDCHNSLRRHMRDNHEDKPRLKCLVRECTVTIAPGRKDNLLKHVRAIHPDHLLPAPPKKRKRK